MKRTSNLLFQGAAFIAQIALPYFVSGPARHAAAAGILAALQGLVGVIAHSYNPDGTPATRTTRAQNWGPF